VKPTVPFPYVIGRGDPPAPTAQPLSPIDELRERLASIDDRMNGATPRVRASLRDEALTAVQHYFARKVSGR